MEKESIINTEARRFKEFRLAENLTLMEIAEIIGRKFSHVQKFEDGSRRIQIKDIKTLHLKLGMSYEWFYHGKGSRKYKENPDKSSLINIVDELRTTIKIHETKIEQLDTALKKIFRDFYAK